MPTNAVTLRATFTQTVYSITFHTSPSTAGSINWGSCSGSSYTDGQTLSTPAGSFAACYVPSGYTFASWTCSDGLSCSGVNDPTVVTVSGAGSITLNLKTGSIPSPAQTSITASPSTSTPPHGTMFTVSGTLKLVSTGVGIGSEPIECVFSWSTNIVSVTTQPDGSYTCTTTAPTTPGLYNIDAFFLGDYSGSPQYLPSKATAMITVT
jgi:hypothetical protein